MLLRKITFLGKKFEIPLFCLKSYNFELELFNSENL